MLGSKSLEPGLGHYSELDSPPGDQSRQSARCTVYMRCLVGRERYAYWRWWATALVGPVEYRSFVMSQRMLRAIPEHAERLEHV